MLCGFTLLDYGNLVKNLHGIQLPGIVASQLPNQKHSSICCGKDLIKKLSYFKGLSVMETHLLCPELELF